MEITTTGKNETKFIGDFDFGTTTDEAVAKFGAEAVFNGFERSAVIAYQNKVRTLLNAGKTDDEIKTIMADWMPGVVTRTPGVKKDPKAAMLERFAKMTPEERKAFIAELKGMQA